MPHRIDQIVHVFLFLEDIFHKEHKSQSKFISQNDFCLIIQISSFLVKIHKNSLYINLKSFPYTASSFSSIWDGFVK